jgi:indolepyruvate ferredoxin oxidoreductase beta subunit
MRSLVKGYGDTHERGRAKFDKLAALVPRLRGQDDAGTRLQGLIKAALADEGDDALDKAIAELGVANSADNDAAISVGSLSPAGLV